MVARPLGARSSPTRRPSSPAAGDRTFAELNANANRLVRALRGAGRRAGDAVALMVSNRPEFAEVVAATQRSGLRHHAHQLAPHRGRGRLHRRRLPGPGVRGRRPLRRRGGRRGRAGRPRATVRLAVGGDIAGFEPLRRRLAGRGRRPTSTTRRSGGRCSTRRAPPADPRACTAPRRRRPPGIGALFGYAPGETCTCAPGPLYHAAPLAFSLAQPAQRRRAASC